MSKGEIKEINAGEVFGATLESFKNGKEVVIHKGGTGSGKTYDIMTFLLFLCTQEKDKIITIVSESKPHLNIGAIRYLKDITKNMGIWEERRWNITESIFTYEPTGTIIEFFSADRIGKALGARRDWLYGNEINSLKFDVWEELARRSKFIIGDFNPTSQFWLEDWMRFYENTEVILSNYLDNPYLPESEKSRIIKRAELDSNFRRVHIDCEYGIFEGLIFEEWSQIDELPEGGKETFGLDFGFTNDPTALVRVVEIDDSLYVEELLYRTGMLNRNIIAELERLGVRKDYDKIIADSAEPKSIEEIHQAGYNVLPAKKGADSVRAGIDNLKSKKLFVTKKSINLIKELRNYRWETDKNGNPTNKPVDDYNHCIDSIRYSLSHRNSFQFSIS